MCDLNMTDEKYIACIEYAKHTDTMIAMGIMTIVFLSFVFIVYLGRDM